MSTSLSVKIEGTEHLLVTRDLSAIDAREFRAETGVSLQEALRGAFLRQDVDLDRLAGFVWLVRRRIEPRLSYTAVALSLNYDTDITVDLAPEMDAGGPEEVGDPEG